MNKTDLRLFILYKARNPNTPKQTLATLSQDKHWLVTDYAKRKKGK
jgi:hypothetical protein